MSCPTLHRKTLEKKHSHNTKPIMVFCLEGVTMSLLHKSQFCVYVCVCRQSGDTSMFVCFMHAEGDDRLRPRHRGVEQQRSTSGNSIFPAAPLCLNSWSQSAFGTFFFPCSGLFFSFLHHLHAPGPASSVYRLCSRQDMGFIRTLIIFPFYHACDPLLLHQAEDLTSNGVFILCGDSLAPGPARHS